MSKGSDVSQTMPLRDQGKTGTLYPYVTGHPGQRSEALTFSPLYSEESGLYSPSEDRFNFCGRGGRRSTFASSTLRTFECGPCTRTGTSVEYPPMRIGRRHGQFGSPPEDLPCRSDQVCCSSWRTAGEFVRESGMPEEQFEWSREINQDTGEWWIHGEVHPTLREKLIAKWLWLKTKMRFARCALGGERWRK